jgi:signal transduction histidine kinase
MVLLERVLPMWKTVRPWTEPLRHASLRSKIVGWSFLPTAIILTAVAVAAFGSYLRAAEDLVLEQSQDLARFAAVQLQGELAKYAELLEDVSIDAGLASLEGVAAQAALEAERDRLVVFDGGALLLDGFGVVRAAGPDRPDLLGADLSNRKYFGLIVRNMRPAFSDLLLDGSLGFPVVAVAVPVQAEGGGFRGVLVGMFRLGRTTVSALYGDVLRLRIVDDGVTIISDGEGRVIYHTQAANILANYSSVPLVGRALAGEWGATRTLDTEGQDVLASFSLVPGTSWVLVAEEPWSSVVAPIRSRELLLLVLLGLGVLVPGLIVMYGVRRLTQPIVDLVIAAQRVARGEYNQSPRTRTGDEIEELATQFNAVAERLRDSDSNLERSRALAVAEERQRLARDLHDAVTQTLFSASITAEVLPRIWERDRQEGLRRLQELRQLTRGALAEMRTLLLELRPTALAEASLPDLLRQLIEALQSRARLQVQFNQEGSCPVPAEVQVALYRIAQEALNNVAKHSQASRVWVDLHCDPASGVRLDIRDDGVGFEMAEVTGDNLGLGIMQERAAEIEADLQFESGTGRGTAVSVAWQPVQERNAVHV